MLTEQLYSEIIEDILKKAANNDELEAYVRLRDYGVENSSDDTQDFKEYLITKFPHSKIVIEGKGLLRITLIM